LITNILIWKLKKLIEIKDCSNQGQKIGVEAPSPLLER
jgi:hypothetical protein